MVVDLEYLGCVALGKRLCNLRNKMTFEYMQAVLKVTLCSLLMIINQPLRLAHEDWKESSDEVQAL